MEWRPEVVRVLLAVLGGAGAVFFLVGWMRKRKIREKIEIARQRRETNLQRMEIQADRLRRQQPVDDPFTILDLPLADLMEKLQSGEVTPKTVLSIYMKRALEVTNQVNCLTDYLPECEEQLERLQHETVRGPLYGVPISLKDNYNYKDYLSPPWTWFRVIQPGAGIVLIGGMMKKKKKKNSACNRSSSFSR